MPLSLAFLMIPTAIIPYSNPNSKHNSNYFLCLSVLLSFMPLCVKILPGFHRGGNSSEITRTSSSAGP